MRLLAWFAALVLLAYAAGHLVTACAQAISTATLAGGVR